MSNRLPPEAPGFMPRRIGMVGTPSSYGIRALKRESEKVALEVIWAQAEREKLESSTISATSKLPTAKA